MDDLSKLREEIDKIDSKIVNLINKRGKLAIRVGAKKKKNEIYRPDRESIVYKNIRAINSGPITNKVLQIIYAEVISACRSLEKSITVSCLGPEGTFSEEATRKRFGFLTESSLCGSIDEVFSCVENQQTDYGVVPIENSTEGAVGRTLDLLLNTNLKICGEINLPVHHCLLSNEKDFSKIRKIFSHSQSFGQCNIWLTKNLKNSKRIPVSSNAEAASMAAVSKNSAAIAGSFATKFYPINLLKRNIEDIANNTTRFVVLGPHDIGQSQKDKTSFIMSTRSEPGSLLELLSPLKKNKVNMTRLESRPAQTGLWQYIFFVDIEGHIKDKKIRSSINEISKRVSFIKILGSYPVDSQ